MQTFGRLLRTRAKADRNVYGSVSFVARLILLVTLVSSPAAACLGGTRGSILVEQQRLQGRLRETDHGGYRVLQIDADDGTVLRQYVNSNGLVFGVAWQSSTVPNFKQWLGPHFAEFQREAKAVGHRHGPLLVRTQNIVVESRGHMRAYRGHACVLQLMPANLTEAALQ